MIPLGEITFVCCIEHGRLENQTVLMITTMRTNGGRVANERILVVVGRFGASLHPETIRTLKELDAELIHDANSNPASWFNYANKIAAVAVAQRLATTPLIAWLDSDVLIAAEPDGLLIGQDFDFAGRCEILPPAVHRADAVHLPYWQRLCELAGTTFDAMPVVRIEHLKMEVHLYFNSGIFVWRRSSAFADCYVALFKRLLDSRLATHDGTFFTADQVILSPLLLAAGLRWKHLELRDHHMTFQSQIEGAIASPAMTHSNAIHYSQSLNPPHRVDFLRRLAVELPKLHGQITAFEPTSLDRSVAVRALAFALRAVRGLRWKLYARRVKRVPRGVVSAMAASSNEQPLG